MSYPFSRLQGGKLNIRYTEDKIDHQWNRSANKTNLQIAKKWAAKQTYVGVRKKVQA